jgi:hypothetical protein
VQRVLTNELWKTVRIKARSARQRRAAIAYVTQDLVRFRQGDTLIVNACVYAVANGETDAKLLFKLHKKGVHVYDCTSLHAKVVLLDGIAIISSGNMSNSSATALIEVGVMTDNSSTVAGVASFIEQLISQSTELQAKDLAKLCKIKVVRRGRWLPGIRKQQKPKISRLGNRTWLVGIHELKDPPQSEQKLIDQATSVLRVKLNDPAIDPDWIRWAGKSRFRVECQEGDSVIQIWRPHKANRPNGVFRRTGVLLKQKTQKWTRFYLKRLTGSHVKMPWNRFKQLLKELGYPKHVGPTSSILLEPDLADAIDRKWISVSKS